MGNFLNLNFWFSVRPGIFTTASLNVMFGFIILMIVLVIATRVVKKKWAKSLYANFWASLSSFFLTNVIVSLLLTFFNYEMVPFLSSRFWFLLWGIAMLVWLFFLYRIIIKIPQKKALREKEREFKKYVP